MIVILFFIRFAPSARLIQRRWPLVVGIRYFCFRLCSINIIFSFWRRWVKKLLPFCHFVLWFFLVYIYIYIWQTCRKCEKRLEQCPICRNQISRRIRFLDSTSFNSKPSLPGLESTYVNSAPAALPSTYDNQVLRSVAPRWIKLTLHLYKFIWQTTVN